MKQNSTFSLNDRLRSFTFAFRGLKFMLQSQHNAWIHLLATIAACSLGLLFRVTASEWCLLVLAVGSVWTSEAFNTAIECLTDLLSPEFHPLAGRAKDVAAAAVLISAIGALVIGLLIFVPHLLSAM